MFRLRFTKKTRVQKFAPDEKLSSSQTSVPVTLATPAPAPAPAPAQPAETGQSQKTKSKWRNGLFNIFQKKKKPEETPPAPLESDTSSDRQTPTGLAKESSCGFFRCCWRRNRVAPAPEPKPEPEPKPFVQKEPQGCSRAVKADTKKKDCTGGFSSVSRPVEFVPLDVPDYDSYLMEPFEIMDESVPSDFTTIMEQFLLQKILEDSFNTKKTNTRDAKNFSKGTIAKFGFPNIGQTCYLNSSLQSLLILKDFLASIRSTEPIWSSVPAAQLLRQLCLIKDMHASPNATDKHQLLRKFKETVALQAPDFKDHQQKDAHEFLTSVLNQIQDLSPLLKEEAARLGTSYTCPVEENLVFWMENTRTCKTCGDQTTGREKFTNISLGVIPEGSIEEMLQAYQREEDLECSCECGGRISSRKSSLDTLPGVFIMQLKRFHGMEKVSDPVQIQRDVVVSSNEGGGCYSLVSAISHFGSIQGGHYIADAVHPDNCPEKPTDRWITLSDLNVTETVGSSVCKQLKKSAFILFYKRQV